MDDEVFFIIESDGELQRGIQEDMNNSISHSTQAFISTVKRNKSFYGSSEYRLLIVKENERWTVISGTIRLSFESKKPYQGDLFSINERLLLPCKVEKFDFNRVSNTIHNLSCGTISLLRRKIFVSDQNPPILENEENSGWNMYDLKDPEGWPANIMLFSGKNMGDLLRDDRDITDQLRIQQPTAFSNLRELSSQLVGFPILHPGTSCPSGHSQNYCKGYQAGAGSSATSNNTTRTSMQADIAHCDQAGWPSCYSVGFQDGKAHPGTPCPSGHSADFCSGWNAGAGNTTHCGSAGYPSCYSVGYADGLQHPGASCPKGHTPNYCAGWNAAAGNTTHCDRPGWPSCYDVGYQAGKANPGTSCPSGHSQAYCNGYATGAGTAPLLDTHCDTPGYPSCYSLGYQAGKSATLGTPCPSGHSMNYCSGWEVGNRLLPNELLVTDASYKTAQNTPIDITLSAKDPDPTAKVTISIISQPTHGNIKSTGSLNRYTYTPNPGFSGIDSFQYSASDDKGIKSNVGTISISVGSTPPPTPNGSLKILSQTHYIDSVDSYHVVGEVENNSSKTASYVEIIGTFYDANGTVVGTSFTFTEPLDLAPGAKAPFDLILISASVPINQIKHYNLQLNSQ